MLANAVILDWWVVATTHGAKTLLMDVVVPFLELDGLALTALETILETAESPICPGLWWTAACVHLLNYFNHSPYIFFYLLNVSNISNCLIFFTRSGSIFFAKVILSALDIIASYCHWRITIIRRANFSHIMYLRRLWLLVL